MLLSGTMQPTLHREGRQLTTPENLRFQLQTRKLTRVTEALRSGWLRRGVPGIFTGRYSLIIETPNLPLTRSLATSPVLSGRSGIAINSAVRSQVRCLCQGSEKVLPSSLKIRGFSFSITKVSATHFQPGSIGRS